MHEAMQTAVRADDCATGAQHQMKRVAEDDLRTECLSSSGLMALTVP